MKRCNKSHQLTSGLRSNSIGTLSFKILSSDDISVPVLVAFNMNVNSLILVFIFVTSNANSNVF